MPAGEIDLGGARVRGAHVRAGGEEGIGEASWEEGRKGTRLGGGVVWWGESGGGVGAQRTHDAVSRQREFSLDSDVIPLPSKRGGSVWGHRVLGS